MHDPDSLALSIEIRGRTLLEIWHHDPCRPGYGDNSCGWTFPHLTPAHIKRLAGLAWSESRYPYFMSRTGRRWVGSSVEAEARYRGLVLHVADFMGIPITIEEATRFASMRIHFPHDAGRPQDGFCFEPGWDTNRKTDDSPEDRQEVFHAFVMSIGRQLLRERRPWYRHPRWHIHHWRIRFPLFRSIVRRLGEIWRNPATAAASDKQEVS